VILLLFTVYDKENNVMHYAFWAAYSSFVYSVSGNMLNTYIDLFNKATIPILLLSKGQQVFTIYQQKDVGSVSGISYKIKLGLTAILQFMASCLTTYQIVKNITDPIVITNQLIPLFFNFVLVAQIIIYKGIPKQELMDLKNREIEKLKKQVDEAKEKINKEIEEKKKKLEEEFKKKQ
jgi:hypothetical protein